MGVSVLMHHAWRVSKRCSLPNPRSQSKDAGARGTPESAGPWAWTSARCIIGAHHAFAGGRNGGKDMDTRQAGQKRDRASDLVCYPSPLLARL